MNPTYTSTEKYTNNNVAKPSNNLMYLNRVANTHNKNEYAKDGYAPSNPSTSTSNTSNVDHSAHKRRSHITNTGTNIIGQVNNSRGYYDQRSSNDADYEDMKYGGHSRQTMPEQRAYHDYANNMKYKKEVEVSKYQYPSSTTGTGSGGRQTGLANAGRNITGQVNTEPTKNYDNLDRRQSSYSNYSKNGYLEGRQNGLNDTFTSQKAKRDVSEYDTVAKPRPIFSRERSPTAEKGCTETGFCTIGLENIGNTCYFNVILQ
jgi:hypothetical protein